MAISRSGVQRIDVELFRHAGGQPVLLQDGLVFLADERVLVPIGNGGAAVANVDRPFVDRLLAGTARLVSAVIVGSVPSDQPQRLHAGAEMRMEPVAAER